MLFKLLDALADFHPKIEKFLMGVDSMGIFLIVMLLLSLLSAVLTYTWIMF